MGCLLAGLLSRNESDVWLLDKNPDRAEVISKEGVYIDYRGSINSVPVKATSDLAQIERADMLLLSVKSYDTSTAIKSCLPILTPETIIVSLQNGIGNAERISKIFKDALVICGATAHGSTLVGHGRIRHAGMGATTLAPLLQKNMEKAQSAADILTGCGMKTTVVNDAQSLSWSKLIINAAINPVTAMANVPNGNLLQDQILRERMRKAASEAAETARKKGVALLYQDEIEEVEQVCWNTRNNISSMLQDIQRHRRTEIDSISGAVVISAHLCGMQVPVSKWLLDRIHEIERKNDET
jgi:2-dehydropantoate 2-reductase